MEWAIGPLGFGELVYIQKAGWDGPFLSDYWASSITLVILVNRAQELN